MNRRVFVQTLGAGAVGMAVARESAADAAAQARFGASPLSAIRAAIGTPIRIGSNENPYGPGPAALAAVSATAIGANRYPGPAVQALIDVVAEKHGVPGRSRAVVRRFRRHPARRRARDDESDESDRGGFAELRVADTDGAGNGRAGESRPAHRRAAARPRRNGRAVGRRRAVLRLQSEQPDGDGRPGRGGDERDRPRAGRVARDVRARRRSVLRVRGPAGFRDRDAAGQEIPAGHHRAHVLEDPRHGRHARRLRDCAAEDDRGAARASLLVWHERDEPVGRGGVPQGHRALRSRSRSTARCGR